jgi:transcriptional regulator with XRE-family HTH domain
MDNSSEVRDFLTTRRERLTPDRAGIPLYGGRRRVKGLRREEVAMLAGMSTDYYTRLERGNLAGVSQSVLEALARALQLDVAERAHLMDLAATANAPGRQPSTSPRRPSRPRGVREGVQRILDSISGPAYVRNVRGDVVATNQLARALFADIHGRGGTGFNMARFLFLDPRSRDFFVRWEAVARDFVAAMRIEAGRNPHDRALTDLVGELSTRSEEFATWWAAHNVKIHTTATKTLRHPIVGEIELTGEALLLPGDPGLVLITYTVEPDSASEQALQFLASWSTQQATGAAPTPIPARPHDTETSS